MFNYMSPLVRLFILLLLTFMSPILKVLARTTNSLPGKHDIHAIRHTDQGQALWRLSGDYI